MRLLTIFLTSLLALTACAAPAKNVSPATQSVPTTIPAKPTTVPAETAASESPAQNPTFENSLLASEWRGNSKGIFLFPLDPTSGTALPGYTPILLGKMYSYAFSPDRRTLAAITFPSDYTYNGSLLLIDLPAWKTEKVELKLDGWVRTMVFSPDGGRLAIAHGESTNKLTMLDLERGRIIAQEETDPLVTHMKFTGGGDALMLYGSVIDTTNGMSGGPPQVLLLDATDLSPRWSAELEGVREGIFPTDENATSTNLHEPGQALYLSPGVAFAPEQDELYIVHADSEQLTTVAFGDQKVKTVEIRVELSWLDRLLSLTAGVAYAKIGDGTSKQAAISPDGQFLYAIGVKSASYLDQQGNWQMNQTLLGLEIIQTSDGSRLERFETEAAEMSLSPDGRFLYLRNWANDGPWTEIFDTSSRQLVTRRAEYYVTPALQMNGGFLLVSTYSTSETSHHMSVLEPDSLSVLADWTGSNYISWLTIP